MNLKCIMLSETSKIDKDKYCIVSLRCQLKNTKGKLIETEARRQKVARGGGGRDEEGETD